MNTSLFDDPHQAELAEALHFSLDDLSCNQRGYLTEGQYERIKYDQFRSQGFAVCTSILSVGAVAVVILALIDSDVQPGIVLAVASILVALIFLGAPSWLKHEELDSLESVICATVKIPGLWLLFQTSMWHDDQQIIFSRNLLRKLRSGQTYHIYFVPVKVVHGNIVSIEPTDDSPDQYAKRKRKRSPDKSKRAA